ncbi:MAG TPA: response regulator transcription factor [Chthoniobacteraceae bacterium]|jgi:DNA-binding NarL/FixJ family response regulator
MKEVRILLADDHEVVRKGVRLLIEKVPGWTVCGEAGTGRQALVLAEELNPDVVVLDINMPDLNGLDAIRQIKRANSKIETLVFTGIENEKLVHDVFEAGARSYILKSDISSHLVSAIEAVAQHKTYFTTKISEIVFARYLQGKSRPISDVEPGSRLTPREREIVQLLAEGKSNKQVAANLGISVKTAETHRAAIMRKLGFEAFSELIRYAIRNHIIEA